MWLEFLKLKKYGHNHLVYSRNLFLLYLKWILADVEYSRHTLMPPLREGTEPRGINEGREPRGINEVNFTAPPYIPSLTV